MQVPYRTASILLAASLLTGCHEDPQSPLQTLDQEDSSQQTYQVEGPKGAVELAVPPDSVFADEPMLSIARALPSTFGGIWYDPDDPSRLIVGLTNTALIEEAEAIIRPLLGDNQPSVIVATEVDRPFLALASYRTALRQKVFSTPGVISLGVDESENTVSIGVESASIPDHVRQLLLDLGVPEKAVRFHEATPPTVGVDLNSYQPDAEVEGAWRIVYSSSSGGCTLGFPVLDPNDNYSEHFVINSHCTLYRAEPDGGEIRQPNWSNGITFGYEVKDPYPHVHNGYLSRHSDAALISASVPLQLGEIARTVERETCDDCAADLTVDASNPTIEVTGRSSYTLENEHLDKMGQKTGWSTGAVESTCDDINVAGLVRRCSDRIDFSFDDGDSGSPVFRYKADGTAELRGIGWGHNTHQFPYGYDAWISDLDQIEKDLGPLYLFDPPAQADILGPSSVPAGVPCEWTADASGRPPFAYEWRKDGVMVGTGSSYSVSSTGFQNFSLSLKITDQRSLTSTDDLVVVVDTNDSRLSCS